jgi:hypothetical protein
VVLTPHTVPAPTDLWRILANAMARTATTFIARRPSAGCAQCRWAASAKELESAIAGTLLRWLIPGRARHGWCFRVRSRPPRFAPAVVDFDPAISETGQPSDYGPPNAVAGAAAFRGVLILLWVESLDQTQGYSVGLASTTKITGSALAAQLVLTPPRPPRSATTGYPTGRTPPQSSSEGPQSTTTHPLTPFKRYSAGLSDITVDPPLIRQSPERAIRWVRAGIRVWWLRRARLRRR